MSFPTSLSISPYDDDNSTTPNSNEKRKKKTLLSPRKRTTRKPSVSQDGPDPVIPSPRPGLQQKIEFADQLDQIPIVIQGKVLDYPIDRVTVYSSQAEVTRRCSFSFSTTPHQYRIVIEGFPPTVDPNTMRMSINPQHGTILEVSYRERLEKEPSKDKDPETLEVEKLEEKRELLEKEISILSEELHRLERGIKWIDEYKDALIPPHDKDIIDPDVSFQILDFLNERLKLSKIHQQRTLQKQEKEIEMEDLHQEIQKKTKKSEKIKILEVLVFINPQSSDDKLVLNLVYLVTGGFWSSGYQARFTENDNLSIDSSNISQIELTYYATVQNSSGEHWNDCTLILSTATPSSKGEIPALVQTILQTKRERHVFEKRKKASSIASNSINASYKRNNESFLEADYEELSEQSVVRQNDLTAVVSKKGSTASYEIPRKSSIPTDNLPHKVTVAVTRFDANISYQIVPLYSSHAYRLAQCLNNSQLEFLAGETQVYVNQNLVTISKLGHTHPQQEFTIYMGVDPSVSVSHSKRIYSKTVGMFHSSNEDKDESFFQIYNNTNQQISTSIMAQLPQSNQQGVEVKLVEPAPNSAKLDEYNNVIWKINIPKGQTVEIPFVYSVHYPLNTGWALNP